MISDALLWLLCESFYCKCYYYNGICFINQKPDFTSATLSKYDSDSFFSLSDYIGVRRKKRRQFCWRWDREFFLIKSPSRRARSLNLDHQLKCLLLPRNVVTLENHFVIKGTNAGILNAPQRFKKDRFLPLATCQTWRWGCQIVEYDFLTLRCHWLDESWPSLA